MIPPTYRRPLQFNAGLLAVAGLLLGYGYLLPKRNPPLISFLLTLLGLLLVYLTGLLLNGALLLRAYRQGRENAVLVYLAAATLWGLALYQLIAAFGDLKTGN